MVSFFLRKNFFSVGAEDRVELYLEYGCFVSRPRVLVTVGNPQLRLRRLYSSLLFTTSVGRLVHAVIYQDITLSLTMRLNLGKLVIAFVTFFR